MLSYIFILWFVMSTISTVISNVALVIQLPLFIMQTSLVTVNFAFTAVIYVWNLHWIVKGELHYLIHHFKHNVKNIASVVCGLCSF